MDVVNFDALVAQGRIILASQVNLDEDYFILGHHDTRRREFKATDYPIYAIHARDLLAPAINNRDRQFDNSVLPTSTNSAVYIDLPNLGLSTNELDPVLTGALGNYQIHFVCTYNPSDSMTSAQFMLNIGGVDIVGSATTDLASLKTYRVSIIWQVNSLPANTIIKIKHRIVTGDPMSTITVNNRSLMIDGVNILSVV